MSKSTSLKNIFAITLINAVAFSTACAQKTVETNAPSADYKPAFEGQTRINSVKTNGNVDFKIINAKLERPWGISQMPNGDFLISQKEGTMVILSADGKLKKKIAGLPQVDPSGQGGLLDITLDPNFAQNRMIYWAYSEAKNESTLLAIAKGKLADNDSKIENIKVIYRATPAHTSKLHYGSRIVFDKNGNLFVSAGERSDLVTRVQAQQLNSSLGKILHITPNGDAVPNGPFANTPNARPEIYALGLRNPDGLAINPQTGDLWEAEFGPKGGDEINIIKSGKNYGWATITYGTEYSGKKVGEGITQKDGLEQPVYYWNPSISPGSIAFYNSNVISEWKGNLFVGALSGSHIIRLVIKNDKIVGEERLLEKLGERFRDLVEGKDGALYTITDNGNLYRIIVK